ncbi:hypothetical protein CLOM_g21950 [Closterium sp. NIES-68]|nr:hypothetical protein CLOM_g21950 [Closterium sp. NIES-68]
MGNQQSMAVVVADKIFPRLPNGPGSAITLPPLPLLEGGTSAVANDAISGTGGNENPQESPTSSTSSGSSSSPQSPSLARSLSSFVSRSRSSRGSAIASAAVCGGGGGSFRRVSGERSSRRKQGRRESREKNTAAPGGASGNSGSSDSSGGCSSGGSRGSDVPSAVPAAAAVATTASDSNGDGAGSSAGAGDGAGDGDGDGVSLLEAPGNHMEVGRSKSAKASLGGSSDGSSSSSSNSSNSMVHTSDSGDRSSIRVSRSTNSSSRSRSSSSISGNDGSSTANGGSTSGQGTRGITGSSSSSSSSSGFGSGRKARGMGILSFEVASTMLRALELWAQLKPAHMDHLKTILQSDGVTKMILGDHNHHWRLAGLEYLRELQVLSSMVCVLSRRCSDPRMHRLTDRLAELEAQGEKHMRERGERDARERGEREGDAGGKGEGGGGAGDAGEEDWFLYTPKEEAFLHKFLEKKVAATNRLHVEMTLLDNLMPSASHSLRMARFTKDAPAWAATAIAGSPFVRERIQSQLKLIRRLQRESLWVEDFDKCMMLLAAAVVILSHRVRTTFRWQAGGVEDDERAGVAGTVGEAGLSIRYAHTLQILDRILNKPTLLLRSQRDDLYRHLPSTVKHKVRRRLSHRSRPFDVEVAAEMRRSTEQMLAWVLPMAQRTLAWQAEHSYGCHLSKRQRSLHIQTLHYVDRDRFELLLVEMLVSLSYFCRPAGLTNIRPDEEAAWKLWQNSGGLIQATFVNPHRGAGGGGGDGKEAAADASAAAAAAAAAAADAGGLASPAAAGSAGSTGAAGSASSGAGGSPVAAPSPGTGVSASGSAEPLSESEAQSDCQPELATDATDTDVTPCGSDSSAVGAAAAAAAAAAAGGWGPSNAGISPSSPSASAAPLDACSADFSADRPVTGASPVRHASCDPIPPSFSGAAQPPAQPAVSPAPAPVAAAAGTGACASVSPPRPIPPAFRCSSSNKREAPPSSNLSNEPHLAPPDESDPSSNCPTATGVSCEAENGGGVCDSAINGGCSTHQASLMPEQIAASCVGGS